MTPVFWPRVYANRLFIVLLVALIYGLLVSVKAQRVFLQGAAPTLDSLALPWFQFGISILVSLIFLAVGALVWLYASERRVALLLFGFCSTMMMNFAALSVGSASDVSSFYLLFDAISSASTALSVPLLAALLLLFPNFCAATWYSCGPWVWSSPFMGWCILCPLSMTRPCPTTWNF
ncbi:MAG: hypothetical protein E6J44_06090 [Chloroflexi bacterium]|nr:MAG: hypothetical protein E6J44_06090 [Chloroflexota bacterium]